MAKVYLSGPMRGYPESNYPAFAEAAHSLRMQGHEVYSPHEFPHNGPAETFPMREAFAAYCKFICEEAEAIVMLPGWEKSKGATIEHSLAVYLGLQALTY